MKYKQRIDLPRQLPTVVGLFEGFLLDAAFTARYRLYDFEHYSFEYRARPSPGNSETMDVAVVVKAKTKEALEEGIESVLHQFGVDSNIFINN